MQHAQLAWRRQQDTGHLGAASYAKAWAPYVWSVSSVDDLKIAPLHLLASEGRVRFD